MNSFVGKSIKDTYQSVLHIGNDNNVYDGTGSQYTVPSSSHSDYSLASAYSITASYASSSNYSINIKSSYEYINKNIKDYQKTFSYSGDTLICVTHSVDETNKIYKNFVYDINNNLTTSSFSGNLPQDLTLTKKIYVYDINNKLTLTKYE